LIKKECSFYE